jgi:hypothetical protein
MLDQKKKLSVDNQYYYQEGYACLHPSKIKGLTIQSGLTSD